MSAAVIGQLLSACGAASSAVWWAASLPPTCRESWAHAAPSHAEAPRLGTSPQASGRLRLLGGGCCWASGGRPADCTPRLSRPCYASFHPAHRTYMDPHRHGVLHNCCKGTRPSSRVRVVASVKTAHPRHCPHRQHFGRRCCGPAPDRYARSPRGGRQSRRMKMYEACPVGRRLRIDAAPSPGQASWGGGAP